MTEALGGSELPTGGSASLFKVKHCEIDVPHDLCVTHRAATTQIGHLPMQLVQIKIFLTYFCSSSFISGMPP